MDESIPIETIESGPGTAAVVNTAQNEVTICRAFWHAGHRCRVVRFRNPISGWYCGYVKTDLSSEITFHDLMDSIDAHGGLTYGVDAEGWIGFDTHHAFDVSLDAEGAQLTGTDEEYPSLMDSIDRSDDHGHPRHEWTPAVVAAECERIAEQLGETES